MNENENPSNYGVGRGIGPIASTSALANVLGVTKTRIGQLVQEGVLVKMERGKFALCDSVNRYVNYLRNQPKNQWGAKGEGETDFERERLRRTKEEADKLELLNAKTRGELVDVEKVKRLHGTVTFCCSEGTKTVSSAGAPTCDVLLRDGS